MKKYIKLSYRIGSFLTAPIYLHVSTVLALLYFVAKEGYINGVIMTVCFLLLMLFHEMGHAWFVKKYRHNLIEIKLYPIHGHCLYEYDYEFEPETLIHAGGLIVQAILFFMFWLLLALLNIGGFDRMLSILNPITIVFIDINLIVFLLNALPIPGLDGFELWKRFYYFVVSFFKKRLPRQNERHEKNTQASKVVTFSTKRRKK